MKRVIAFVTFLALLLPFFANDSAVQAGPHAAPARNFADAGAAFVDPRLGATFASLPAEEMTTVIVTLKEQADLNRIPGADRASRQEGVIRALQALADASQRQIIGLLEAWKAQGQVSDYTSFWILNALSVTATAEVIEELAAHSDVQSITPDDIRVTPAALQSSTAPEPNLTLVNAPALWSMGYYGQDVVVASMDSGVDINHPELAGRWRGGDNSWYDPHGEHPLTPTDLSGHGTAVMGVMVGGDAAGTAIGLAPQAQWIAVKIFDDSGNTTATAIHQGFQWLLDPDGDPGTPDAAYVVNNSWTNAYPGCDLEFELDLNSLRAAGIVPVFAAGNSGPSADSSMSPANNPGAFAVGAADDNDAIYGYSSRGPSACDDTIFPEVVAPGVGIHTTDLYGSYRDATGTSMAAPHVSGGLALLLSAFPDLSASGQETALLDSAVDLDPAGPDNDSGYGRLDLLAAYDLLNAGDSGSTSTPTPTSMPTPTPPLQDNLALNKPVAVSSYQDEGNNGPMAVDGALDTFWKTKKAVGKKRLPSEWIKLDLGSNATISDVVLHWEAYYATDYTIAVSEDDKNWSTLFATTSGDGETDAVSFEATVARYVMLDSTAWVDGSMRNWLVEFEVYGTSSDPAPTATPTPEATATATPDWTPTPTSTSTPTPTSTAAATPTPIQGSDSTMHVGALSGSSSPGSRNRWEATVTVWIHDANEALVADATVKGSWSDGASGIDSCTTDASGACTMTKGNLKSNVSSVSFTVQDVSHTVYSYQPSANHDPSGDGTHLVILQP